MVSKRQRDARKRFRESHPELSVKPEPKDPIKGKKKLAKLKQKLSAPKDTTKTTKPIRSSRKHPLRIVKPGDSCFICKSSDHLAKNCPEKAQWEKNKICLFCRARGHSLKNCPRKNDESETQKFCYNCGGTGHSLARCPQPLQDGGTKFASCFICNERGHLSKNCPRNTHGIYPKGGCCNVCGGVTHLARDCPNKYSGAPKATGFLGKAAEFKEKHMGHTRFTSGDDLEDDFTAGVKVADKAKNPSESKASASALEEKGVKPKKHGPKVINFVG